MGRDTRHLLVGAAARPDERRALEGVLDEFDDVVAVTELLTSCWGPNALQMEVFIDPTHSRQREPA